MNLDTAALTKLLTVVALVAIMLSVGLKKGVGLGIHEWAPRLTEGFVKPIGSLANLLLLGVVGLILATHYQTLGAIRLRGWAGMMILLAASLGIGWLCGEPAPATRRALAITTGLRNAAVGLVIVTANFAGTPAVTAVVAYALVSILGTLGCAVLLGRLTVKQGLCPGNSIGSPQQEFAP